MKKIGFTGTRNEITFKQNAALHDILYNHSRILGSTFLHHGDCVGADKTACLLAQALRIKTISHPPIIDTYRAFTKFNFVTMEPEPYLIRNRNIVDICDFLIACPKGKEHRRSGTWSTIRYALAGDKEVMIIKPSGTINNY